MNYLFESEDLNIILSGITSVENHLRHYGSARVTPLPGRIELGMIIRYYGGYLGDNEEIWIREKEGWRLVGDKNDEPEDYRSDVEFFSGWGKEDYEYETYYLNG